MSDQKARPRGRPAKAGRYVRDDWELLIQMWPLVTEKGLPVKTAAHQVTEGMPGTADQKTAAVNRVRRRFPAEKHLIRAEVERRRREAQSARPTHAERNALKGCSSPFVSDVMAAKQRIASSHGANAQKAMAWNRRVRAALNGRSNELEAQLIRQAVENARTVPARLSDMQSSRQKKRGK